MESHENPYIVEDAGKHKECGETFAFLMMLLFAFAVGVILTLIFLVHYGINPSEIFK